MQDDGYIKGWDIKNTTPGIEKGVFSTVLWQNAVVVELGTSLFSVYMLFNGAFIRSTNREIMYNGARFE